MKFYEIVFDFVSYFLARYKNENKKIPNLKNVTNSLCYTILNLWVQDYVHIDAYMSICMAWDTRRTGLESAARWKPEISVLLNFTPCFLIHD
jgi:hypothetical protein